MKRRDKARPGLRGCAFALVVAGVVGLLGCIVGHADVGWDHPGAQAAGAEPLELLFAKVAVPVAGLLTRGAFLRDWRLMAIDGFELDVPDTPANAAAFGYPAGAREHPARSRRCGW